MLPRVPPPANTAPLPRNGAPVTTTYLEMRDVAALRPKRASDPAFRIEPVSEPQWQLNRFLYRTIGADWSWNDKRGWTDAQWQAYVASPQLRTFVALRGGAIAGYFELREDGHGGIEIAYFGLMPGFTGRGYGGALLTRALEEAWSRWPSRVWVHTCTLDHPGALPNYRARGMTVYREETK